MSKKASSKKDVAPAAETPVTETPAAGTDTPAAAPAQDSGLVTVADLVTIIKFLEELARMKRLSDMEIVGIKPSFDRVVSFLALHEESLKQQQNAANPVTQTQEELLDLPKTDGKKKANKKHK